MAKYVKTLIVMTYTNRVFYLHAIYEIVWFSTLYTNRIEIKQEQENCNAIDFMCNEPKYKRLSN